jgi:hypothetical protein
MRLQETFLACVMVWGGCALAAENNLLTNPGFEKDANADGIPDGWTFDVKAWTGVKGVIDWERGSAHSGDYSASISVTNAAGGMSVSSSVAPVKPATTYRFSGWLRADLAAAAKETRAYFSINGYRNGEFTRELGFTPFVQASSGWQQYTVEIAADPVTDGLTIQANLFGPGRIWIDDLACVENNPAEPPPAPPAGQGATAQPVVEDSAGNLVKNGGAENDADGNGVPDHWTATSPTAAVWSTEYAHSGTRSLKVTLKPGEGLIYWGQFGIPVVPGQKKYRATFHAMTESFGQDYVVYMEGSRNGVPPTGLAGVADQGEGKGIWHKKGFTFDMPNPASAETIYIIFHMGKPGTVWYDDISIEEIPEDKEVIAPLVIRLSSPAFRDTIFATEVAPQIVGEVSVNEAHPAGECRVRITDAADKIIAEEAFPCTADQGKIAFRFAADAVAVGSYTLSASLQGGDGRLLEARLPLRRLGPAAGEIRFREDQVLLINGQPFFPIGLWQGGNLGEIAAAGFNMVMCDAPNNPVPSNFRANMAQMAAYGLKGFAQLSGDRTYNHAKDAAELIDSIKTGARHVDGDTTFLGWAVDEPVWGGSPLEYALTLYGTIRENYPYQLNWVNHAPRNSSRDLAAWNRYVDITSSDIYPVPEPSSHSDLPNATLSVVGDETIKQSQTVAGEKAVWMVLQGFGWQDINQPGKRPPSWEETRFMAYDALINGAKGLWWWGSAYTPKPSPFWSDLKRLAGELRDVSAVLTSPDATLPLTVTGASAEQIRWLAKDCAGVLYLFVENRLNQKATVTLAGVSSRADRLRVVFEERTIACNKGAFTDTFEPYAVHIYTDGTTLPQPLVPTTPRALEYAQDAVRLEEVIGRGFVTRKWDAEWIWHAERLGAANTSVFARQEISLETAPREAWVQVTADDSFVFQVNGKVVGRGGGWQAGQAFEITAFLKPGKNVIAVEGINGTNQCGIILQGTIETGKERLALKTDSSWQVSLAPDAGWAAADVAAANWKPAHVFGAPPVAPWGNISVYMGERSGD